MVGGDAASCFGRFAGRRLGAAEAETKPRDPAATGEPNSWLIMMRAPWLSYD